MKIHVARPARQVRRVHCALVAHLARSDHRARADALPPLRRLHRLFILLLLTGAIPLMATDPARMISVGGGVARNFETHSFVASDNGLRVAFTSKDLLAGGRSEHNQCYLKDQSTGVVTMISHAAGDPNQPSDGECGLPRISGDGTVLVFQSQAIDLIAGVVDGNDDWDAYRFDVATGSRTLLSHAAGDPLKTANDESRAWELDADGDHILLTSEATDLLVGFASGSSGVDNLYLHDGTGLRLVSRDPTTVAGGGDADSFSGQINDAGTKVVFSSRAGNLGFNDALGHIDVFVYDVAQDTIELLTRSADNPTIPADNRSNLESVDAAGSRIVIESTATNLIADFVSVSGLRDQIYLYDLSTGGVSLISRAHDNPLKASDGDNEDAVISADGSTIAFESEATNLISGLTLLQDRGDVYRYDIETETIRLISHLAASPAYGGDGESDDPQISGDGRWVIFQSESLSLISGAVIDPKSRENAYLWDEQTQTLGLASHRLGEPLQSSSEDARSGALAVDGSFAFFTSDAQDLVSAPTSGARTLYSSELDTLSTTLVSTLPIAQPSVRGGASFYGDRRGRWITEDGTTAIYLGESDSGNSDQLYAHDTVAGTRQLLSGPVPGEEAEPYRDDVDSASICGTCTEARIVAFETSADDLVAGYVGSDSQVYVRDLDDGETRLVSRNHASATQGAGGTSSLHSVSADGSAVLFWSDAGDLVPGFVDNNGSTDDLYLYDVITDTMTLVSQSASSSIAGADARLNLDSSGLDDAGQRVVFSSRARNLVSGLLSANQENVFLFDAVSGTTKLVNHVGSSSCGDRSSATHCAGNAAATEPAISGNGLHVAFRSKASDLIYGMSSCSRAQIYRYSVADRLHELASSASGAVPTCSNGPAQKPAISRDGMVIAFESTASNLLSSPDTGSDWDLFVWEHDDNRSVADQHLLVTHAAGDVTAYQNDVDEWELSVDGSRIAFTSEAGSYVAGESGPEDESDLYLYDLSSRQHTLVSHSWDDVLLAIGHRNRAFDLNASGSLLLVSSYTPTIHPAIGFSNQVLLHGSVGRSDLALALSAPTSTAANGSTVELPYEIDNLAGEGTALRVALEIEVGTGSSFEGYSGSGWACWPVGQTVFCDWGPLPAGEVASPLVFEIRVGGQGSASISARVSELNAELDESNNEIATSITIEDTDFGDAPSPFPTMLSADGARHRITSLFLGSLVDADLDGQPAAQALGDDLDGGSDDDGVEFPTALIVGELATVNVSASGAGFVDAWIDGNLDGSWSADEQVLSSAAVSAGVNALEFIVPAHFVGDAAAIARFRLSSTGGLGIAGFAADGEVEDHEVAITAHADLQLTLDDGLSSVMPGATVTYTATVTNLGPSASTGAVFTDPLPAGLVFAGSSDGCSADPDQVVTCPLAASAAGVQQQVRFTATVDVTPPALLRNVGGVDGNELDLVLANSSSTDDTSTDGVAPRITGVTTSAEPITACGALRQAPDAVTVSFDEAMWNPAGSSRSGDVTNPFSYLLVSAGADRSFESEGCSGASGDDLRLTVDEVVWNGGDNQATLQLPGPLPQGLHRLFVCEGAQDLAGNWLDGDVDGTTGGEYTIGFRVDPGNLFENGHFDCGADAWDDPVHPAYEWAAWSDHQDSENSGSAEIQSELTRLAQCVSAGADPLEFSGSTLLEGIDQAADVEVACQWFADTACAGSVLASDDRQLLRGKPSIWQPFRQAFESVPGAGSVHCEVFTDASGATLLVDGLRLIGGAFFADGFESGDLTGWSSSIP